MQRATAFSLQTLCAVLLQLCHNSDLVSFGAETTVLANDLKKEDFKVISLHPGFVATDMGANASDLMSAIRPGKLSLLAAFCYLQSQALQWGHVAYICLWHAVCIICMEDLQTFACIPPLMCQAGLSKPS